MRNMTGDKLLFIDTETGGIDPKKHSLLSIGLVVWDCKEGITDSIEILIKNNEYIFTKEAQKINKFNKLEHEKNAISQKDSLNLMLNFIYKHFSMDELIPLAGHNTQFDVNFLKEFLTENGRSFNRIFSHRIIDTYSIIRFLVYAGKISEEISSSSQAFIKFNIKVENRHTAKDDAIATVKLFESLLELISC